MLQFKWLLLKLVMRLDKTTKAQQMMSNDHFVRLCSRIDLLSLINQLSAAQVLNK
jgi:hypothetical protein